MGMPSERPRSIESARSDLLPIASCGTASAAPSADPRVATPLFRGPLHELCAIGLSRSALAALVAGETPTPPAIDRDYLLKVLDEEAGRQFGHPLRPIVELCLNGVDASHAPGATVAVRTAPGRVEVLDEGVGMTLGAILSRLLVPFATDKHPGVDIGRFGVGFFSVLAYGLAHPESFALDVTTGDGVGAWVLRVRSTGRDASALTCSVEAVHSTPEAARRGTRVTVRSALIDADALRSYLRDALHFFPAGRASITVDGTAVNDGSLLCGGRLFVDRVEPEGAPPMLARFHLGGRGLAGGISAATYHSGVKVESCLAISELALIDFPGAVELTEGRDALKPGPEFTAVAIGFYRRLVRIAQAPQTSARDKERIAEVAAQVSSMLLQSAGFAQLAPEIARELLGPERYLVSPERAEPIVGFLGAAVAPLLFVPESFWAEREWHGHLPGERELIERELFVDPPETLAALAARRPDLEGVAVLAQRISDPRTLQVALARARATRRPCTLPCLGTRRAVLLREDCVALRSPRGWAPLYALRAAFDRASGLRESEVERDLIVSDPIGALAGVGA
jgi:hypothetical protein